MVEIENTATKRGWRRCVGIVMCTIAVGAGLAASAAEAHAEEEYTLATIPSPFAVTGQEAGGVTASKATLWGDVYPGGKVENDTKYRFEYGTTTSYGSDSSEGNAGSEIVGKTVSMEIGSLSTGTTYHYRIVAWNSQGTYYGADRTFVAGGEPVVFDQNTAGELDQFARVAGGAWWVGDITTMASGPDISESAPISVATELLVFGRNPEGELVVFYRSPTGGWGVVNITGVANGNPDISGTPMPEVTSSGELLVFARNTSSELVGFWRESGGGWKDVNVTGVANGNPDISESPGPLITPSGELLVFAREPSGELIGFWRESGGGWKDVNITGLTEDAATVAYSPAPIIG